MVLGENGLGLGCDMVMKVIKTLIQLLPQPVKNKENVNKNGSSRNKWTDLGDNK